MFVACFVAQTDSNATGQERFCETDDAATVYRVLENAQSPTTVIGQSVFHVTTDSKQGVLTTNLRTCIGVLIVFSDGTAFLAHRGFRSSMWSHSDGFQH